MAHVMERGRGRADNKPRQSTENAAQEKSVKTERWNRSLKWRDFPRLMVDAFGIIFRFINIESELLEI
jgi:deoxyribodipyrimidine photolyase